MRPALLYDVDDHDEDAKYDERDSTDVDAQVGYLVDERKAHDIGWSNDEHHQEVENGKPSKNRMFQIRKKIYIANL